MKNNDELKDKIIISKDGVDFVFPVDSIDTQTKYIDRVKEYSEQLKLSREQGNLKETKRICKLLKLLEIQKDFRNGCDCQTIYEENEFLYESTRSPLERQQKKDKGIYIVIKRGIIQDVILKESISSIVKKQASQMYEKLLLFEEEIDKYILDVAIEKNSNLGQFVFYGNYYIVREYCKQQYMNINDFNRYSSEYLIYENDNYKFDSLIEKKSKVKINIR